MGSLQEQLRLSEKLLAEATMTWEQKVRQAEALAEQHVEMVSFLHEHVATLTQQLADAERARVREDMDLLRSYWF